MGKKLVALIVCLACSVVLASCAQSSGFGGLLSGAIDKTTEMLGLGTGGESQGQASGEGTQNPATSAGGADANATAAQPQASVSSSAAQSTAAQKPSNPNTLDATSGPITLTGTIEREEVPTARTGMVWSAVVYWLVFDEPVTITFTGNFGEETATFDKITAFQIEQGAADADKKLDSITDPEWQPHVGEKVTVRAKVINTGNAHTMGAAKLLDAKIQNPSSQGQSQAGVSGASKKLDLTKSSDYHDINLFLSNFAEWPAFWEREDYDGSRPDKLKVVDWAFWHHALNDDALVREDFEVPGATNGHAKGAFGTPGPWFGRYTDTASVERAIRRYLGFDWSLSGYVGGYYAEYNGSIGDDTIRGSLVPKGYVVLADKVSDNPDGSVDVDFTMYLVDLDVVTDDSWFSMTPSELTSKRSPQVTQDSFAVQRSGRATVTVNGSDADSPFTLLAFSVS